MFKVKQRRHNSVIRFENFVPGSVGTAPRVRSNLFSFRSAIPSRVAGLAAGAALALAGLALAATESHASEAPAATHSHAPDSVWQKPFEAARACERDFNTSAAQSRHCLLGRGLFWIMETSEDLVNRAGKQAFGEHFHFVSKPQWPAPGRNQATLGGDLDMVIPFTTFDTKALLNRDSLLFLQQGVTRWWDSSGTFRNDMRYGLAHRMRLTDDPGSDIVGMYAFYLHSLEYEHGVLVSGFDYAGRWGTGSFRYFLPTTGWQNTRTGHEERALEGIELGLTQDLTSTVEFSVTGYRWQREDGAAGWRSGARLGLEWNPHGWLNFRAGYDGIGTATQSMLVYAGLSIPLGGTGGTPRWEGLGVAAGGAVPSAQDLSRPVQELGQIRVATRASQPTTPNDVSVRFLHDSVNSGDSVQVEVSLQTVASEDVRVIVRLAPGDGGNPAVAGEDFVDEPVEATIASGTQKTVVTIQLLLNDNMQEGRSLDVTASIVS